MSCQDPKRPGAAIRRIASPGLFLCAVLLWTGLFSGLAGCRAQEEPEGQVVDDPVSIYLLERIRRERAKRDLPELEVHPDVHAVAQTLADEVEAYGGWVQVDLSAERVASLLEGRGYRHHELITTYYAGGTGEPWVWVDDWMTRGRATFDNLHQPDLRHVGVGHSRLGDGRFYLLLASTSRTGWLKEQTRDLQDLDAVREQVRAAVNAERGKYRLRPMESRHELDEVAQSYAEDMLRRDFYGHTSPEGESVRDRVVRSDYKRPRVGENLASGHTSVEQVMEGWMASPSHRANILHKRLREIGVGLAMGETDAGEFKILWVQVFAGKR